MARVPYQGASTLKVWGLCDLPFAAYPNVSPAQLWLILLTTLAAPFPAGGARGESFSKASRGPVGLGRVGSGRAYSDFSLKPQKNSLRASRSARNKLCLTRAPLGGGADSDPLSNIRDNLRTTYVRYRHQTFSTLSDINLTHCLKILSNLVGKFLRKWRFSDVRFRAKNGRQLYRS